MSNFHPTVGRNVQYLDSNGKASAALIIFVANDSSTVGLQVFPSVGDMYKAHGVKPFVAGARASENTNCYLLNWQGR